MNPDRPPLNDLLARLQAMPAKDREFVLSALSDTESAQLMPLLSDRGQVQLSPDLTRLVALCGSGESTLVTSRVAQELVKAAHQVSNDAGMQSSAANAPYPSLWDRIIAPFHGKPARA